MLWKKPKFFLYSIPSIIWSMAGTSNHTLISTVGVAKVEDELMRAKILDTRTHRVFGAPHLCLFSCSLDLITNLVKPISSAHTHTHMVKPTPA
jgi:hypothetical protein